MELKSLLDDFATACGDHKKISYDLWRQLTKFAGNKKGNIYFLRHPDITNRNLLGVLFDFETEYYLYIPEDPLCPTGYLNQYIYNTPFYKQGIYPPLDRDINWPKCIDTMLEKHGWTFWPVKEFNELIKKESEPKENKCQFKATPVQAATIENINNCINNSAVSLKEIAAGLNKINSISYDTSGKIVNGDISNATPLTYVSSNIENIATNFNTITSTFDETNERLTKLEKALNNKKENDTMDTNNIINFDFGPVNNEAIRLSPYGLAVRTNQNSDWLTYNPDKSDMMNVNVFNFKMDKFIYKMPAPLGSIKPGDLILHQKIPMFVRSVDNVAGTVEAINYRDSTIASILPVKSPFGFNFVTKIISLIDFSNVNADSDNPFGNMLPMMMLANNDGNNDNLLPLIFMTNGQMNMDNPLMMYFLLKDGDNSNDMLPMLLMSQYMNK